MKRTLLSIAALVLTVSLSGCFDEIVKTYDGPLQVEFAQYYQPFAPATTGANYVSTVAFAHDAPSGASADVALKLQLIGPHQSSETHIGFQVAQQQLDRDGEVVATTTAQEGVHYEIVTSGNRAVFPANNSFSTIEVRAMPGSLAPGQSVRLILQLTEGDQLIPAENYKYYSIVVARAAAPAA